MRAIYYVNTEESYSKLLEVSANWLKLSAWTVPTGYMGAGSIGKVAGGVSTGHAISSMHEGVMCRKLTTHFEVFLVFLYAAFTEPWKRSKWTFGTWENFDRKLDWKFLQSVGPSNHSFRLISWSFNLVIMANECSARTQHAVRMKSFFVFLNVNYECYQKKRKH